MRKFTFVELAKAYCKQMRVWGLYISTSGEDWEVTQAAPYLHDIDDMQLICDGAGFLTFHTEEEMLHVYDQTVGDDGPTELNPYDGSTRVYALTISPNGVALNENT